MDAIATVNLIQHLKRLHRQDGNLLIKQHWSLKNREDLAEHGNKKLMTLVRELTPLVDTISVAWNPGRIDPTVSDDGMNAYHVFYRFAGKRRYHLVGRSLQGQGGADVMDYWERAYPGVLVEFQ